MKNNILKANLPDENFYKIHWMMELAVDDVRGVIVHEDDVMGVKLVKMAMAADGGYVE